MRLNASKHIAHDAPCRRFHVPSTEYILNAFLHDVPCRRLLTDIGIGRHTVAPARHTSARRHSADVPLFSFLSPLSPFLPSALRFYTLIKTKIMINKTYFLKYLYNIEHSFRGGMFFFLPQSPLAPRNTPASRGGIGVATGRQRVSTRRQRGGNAAPPRSLRTCGTTRRHRRPLRTSAPQLNLSVDVRSLTVMS